jgi:hypothetical protein
MSIKITPTQELAQLKIRQAATKVAFEQDQKATERRVAALYEAQRPVHEALDQRYQLRLGISRCEKFQRGFSEDAIATRQTWHREIQSPARQERGPLRSLCDYMIQSESCLRETSASLRILREELSEIEARILRLAKEAGLEALLPSQWPSDPIDE